MKKLFKLACIGFIPLVLGIALQIIGGYVRNVTLVNAAE